MSDPPLPPPVEKTFTSFTKAQGASYSKNRRGYHPDLYKTIIDHHTSTGGQLSTLLDVGCGPGTTARDLASQFEPVIGIDPSEGMIKSARDLEGISSSSEPIRFEVAAAEDLGSHLESPIKDGSVDLITAATAAHWFNMPLFWPNAARVLKPSGTVALWTFGEIALHPSMPNASSIQVALHTIDERELKPFIKPGNLLARELYTPLPFPWALSTPVTQFEESSLLRKEWGPENSDEFFAGGGMEVSLDMMEMVLGTMSPGLRWREENKKKVGKEGEVVRLMREAIEEGLWEAGVEKGKEMVKGSLRGVLLNVQEEDLIGLRLNEFSELAKRRRSLCLEDGYGDKARVCCCDKSNSWFP